MQCRGLAPMRLWSRQGQSKFGPGTPLIRWTTAAGLALTLVLGLTDIAGASHYVNMMPVPRDPVCTLDNACRADNSFHTVYIGYLGPTFRQGVTETLNLSYDTTDLDVGYVSSPTSATDVIYRYQDLPAGTAGEYDCEDPGGYDCGRATVFFDSTEVCGFGCSAHTVRHVACHETGHSVGLVHGEDAYDRPIPNDATSLYCLQTGINLITAPYALGSHNADQIDVVY